MDYQVTGVLKMKKDTEVVSDKFKKREFVITDNSSQYPQHISLQLTQAKCDLIDSFSIGTELKVHFNLRGREWQAPTGELRYFNTLEAWRIEAGQGAASTQGGYTGNVDTNMPQGQPTTFTVNNNTMDDLPF